MRVLCSSLCLAVLGSAAACGPAKPAGSPSHSEEAPPSSPSGSSRAEDEAPNPPSTAEAAPQPPTNGVPYDKEAVEVVLKRAARQVKANCGAATDEDGKAKGPWGKATVTVKLGHNGHSQGATVGPPYDGKPVGTCIARAFAILIFPPFAGGDASVDWPIEVVPPSAAH